MEGQTNAQLTDLDKQVSLHASRQGKAEMSADSSLHATDWFQNRCDIQSLGGSTLESLPSPTTYTNPIRGLFCEGGG